MQNVTAATDSCRDTVSSRCWRLSRVRWWLLIKSGMSQRSQISLARYFSRTANENARNATRLVRKTKVWPGRSAAYAEHGTRGGSDHRPTLGTQKPRHFSDLYILTIRPTSAGA